MKKIYLLFLLLLPAGLISAQEADTPVAEEEPVAVNMTKKVVNPFAAADAGNFLKVNFSSFIARNISFQYERVLSKQATIALGLRFMPSGGIPFRGTIEDLAADDNPEGKRLLHDARAGSFAITPEFRYYLGAGYGKGFYLAPFLRYEHFNISSDYTFTAPDNSMQQVAFSGNDQVYGIGLMIGSQFRLSDHIYLDWWILGPYYNHHNLQLHAGGFSITDEEVGILNDELKKIDLLNLDMQASATNTTASLQAKGSLAALRGFGLCLSVRF